MELNIGRNGFSLPLGLVTATQAILARKRSGKSYTASVEAEELLDCKQQIVVFDPTSAWHGLRSSADGEGVGFPIVVFGGDHPDAPLDYRAGKALATAVVEHGFSAIFDIGNLNTDEQVQFVMDFCSELLRINRVALHVFMDEADTFAPQKPLGLLQNKCLGTVSRLVKQGGIRGVGFTMITQRPASMNKDVLSQVDILTVLRMSHPLDIKAATDWIKSEVTVEFAKEVEAALPSLPVGTAFFCSASLRLGERVEVRTRTTFNSGATPKPGERKIEPKVLAKVDLEKLGQNIAASIKTAEENSVEFLKKRIKELEAAAPVVTTANAEEIAMLAEQLSTLSGHVADLEKMSSRAAEKMSRMRLLVSELTALLSDAEGDTPTTEEVRVVREEVAQAQSIKERISPVPAVAKANSRSEPVKVTGNVSGPQSKILAALGEGLAIGRDPLPRTWLALLAGVSAKSSAFANNLSALRTAGYIDYRPDGVTLTEKGRASVPAAPSLSESQLHERILGLVSGPQASILRVLLPLKARHITRDALADRAGVSATSSAFANNLSALRTLGVIDYGADRSVFATRACFL